MHFKAQIYWNFVCSIARMVGFVHAFICREPAVTQGLINLYGSFISCIQHCLALFVAPSEV